MPAITLLSQLTKYINKDVALIIAAYAETAEDYYQISHYATYQSTLRTVTPTITRGVRLGPDIYYIVGGLQKITGDIIKSIVTPTTPHYATYIAACDIAGDDVIFIVTYELSIIIYNCKWQVIYSYYMRCPVYTCTSSAYGSALYLTYTRFISEKSNAPYGQLIKLIYCTQSKFLYGIKQIRQAPNSQVLASNIDYVCVKAGNKVIIYHADTLQKVARVNIGMAITDGIIKDNHLILRHGQMQIIINLITWKKQITQLKYIMFPDKVFLKK